jgi:hypothetical protein
MSFDFETILNKRGEQLPNYAYKLSAGQYGMDVVLPDSLDIDESRMSVWIPFANGNRRDGVGDLLDVRGIQTDRHRANPVVLFDHGKVITLPIALAEDPQTKAYTVQIDPDLQTATANAFFYQGENGEHALFCEQLFDLIVKRYIRAGSIGYQVIAAKNLQPEYETGVPAGLFLQTVRLLEVSAVVMPANQDTVRKALALPQVCGKPLSPYLVKSLTPYSGEKKIQSGYEGVKVPLRDVRDGPKIPPSKWKPGLGAVKKQEFHPEEDSYRSLETADSPIKKSEIAGDLNWLKEEEAEKEHRKFLKTLRLSYKKKGNESYFCR